MPSQILFPTSIVSKTGVQGTDAANLTSLGADDTNYVLATNNNTNVDIRVGFDSFVGTFDASTTQTVTVIVRQFDTNQNGTPTATVEVYDSGGLVASTGPTNVGTTDTTLTVNFTGSQTTDDTGESLEVRVIGTRTGGSPSNRNTVNIDLIRINASFPVAPMTADPASFTLTGQEANLIGQISNYDEFTFTLPSSALVDFSLMLDLSLCSTSWWNSVDTTDGTKGRAYKQDNTRLAIDWIDFDSVNNTGFARVLWNGTLPTSGSIKLRISPPKSINTSVLSTDLYGSNNAYDTNWEFYSPDGGDDDHTSNGYTGIPGASTSVGTATGKVGDGTDYDPALSDNVRFGDILNFNHTTTDLTIVGWAQPQTAFTDFHTIVSRRNNTNYSYQLRFLSTGVLSCLFTNGSVDSTLSGTIDQWNFCAVSVASGSPTFRLNGSTESVGSGVTYNNTSATDFRLGAIWVGSVAHMFNGILDDIQVHSTARSAAWVQYEYDQTNAPSTFWGTATWVSEFDGYSYDTFSVPTPTTGSVVDFTFTLPYSRFSSEYQSIANNADGNRARFVKNNGVTELPFDCIMPNGVWDSSAYYEVKWIGTLTSISDEILRVYPPQSDRAPYSNPTDAYASHWEGFWFDGGGDDRTSNNNNGSAQGGVTFGGITGKIGVATSYDGTDDSSILNTELMPTGTIARTTLGWHKTNSSGEEPIISYGDDNATGSNLGAAWRHHINNGALQLRIYGSTPIWGSGLADNTWHHTAISCPNSGISSQVKAYIDGSFIASGTNSVNINTGPAIGLLADDAYQPTSPSRFGLIDLNAIEIHSTQLSDEWIDLRYRTQNNPTAEWGTATWVELSLTTYSIQCAEGQFTSTGNATQFTLQRLLSASSESFTFNVIAANLVKGLTLSVDSANFVLSGNDNGIYDNRIIVEETGSFSLTGNEAFIIKADLIFPDPVSFVLNGSNAFIYDNHVTFEETGNFNLAGNNANLLKNYLISSEVSSFTFTGNNANLDKNRILDAQTTQFDLVGNTNNLYKESLLSLDAQSFEFTGNATSLAKEYILTTESESFSVTAQDSNLINNRVLVASLDTFILTGNDVTLSNVNVYVLSAETSSFILTGNQISLYKNNLLSSQVESFALNGNIAQLKNSLILQGNVGEFVLTNNDASVNYNKNLECTTTEFNTAGNNVSLLCNKNLELNTTTFTLSGVDSVFATDKIITANTAAFTLSENEASLSYIKSYDLIAELAEFTLTGFNSSLIVDRNISANVETFNVTLNDSLLYENKYLESSLSQFNIDVYDTNLLKDSVLLSSAEEFVLTGNNVQFVTAGSLNADFAAFTLSGQNSNLLVDRSLVTEFTQFELTGNTNNIVVNRRLSSELSTFTVNTFDTNLRTSYLLSLSNADFLLTGNDSNLSETNRYNVAADLGQYDLIGNNVQFVTAGSLLADTGVFIFTANDSNLLKFNTLSCNSANFTLNLEDSQLKVSRVVGASTGEYSLDGTATSFTYLQPNQLFLNTESAQFTVSGINTSFKTSRNLASETTEYLLSGTETSVNKGIFITLNGGEFSSNYINNSLSVARNLIANSNSIDLTLEDNNTLYNRIFTTQLNTFTFNGLESSLNFARKIISDSRGYSVNLINSNILKHNIIYPDFVEYDLNLIDTDIIRSYILNLDLGQFLLDGNSADFYLKYVLLTLRSIYTTSVNGVDIIYSGEELPSIIIKNLYSINKLDNVYDIDREYYIYVINKLYNIYDIDKQYYVYSIDSLDNIHNIYKQYYVYSINKLSNVYNIFDFDNINYITKSSDTYDIIESKNVYDTNKSNNVFKISGE